MSIESEPNRINACDIDELNYSVDPWQLDMRQISPGTMHAQIDFAQINGMLLSHEHWSQGLSAVGATPAGYLALAVCSTEDTCPVGPLSDQQERARLGQTAQIFLRLRSKRIGIDGHISFLI